MTIPIENDTKAEESPLFYFKLKPVQLLAALIQIPESDRGAWITRVALELAAEKPVEAFAVELYREAGEYRDNKVERARQAGIKSAAARALRKALEEQRLLELAQQSSTPVDFS